MTKKIFEKLKKVKLANKIQEIKERKKNNGNKDKDKQQEKRK